MPPQILNPIDGARVNVHIYLDTIHEQFDVGELSSSFEYPETTFWQRLSGNLGAPFVDETCVKRTFTGTATVHQGRYYEGPPLLEHWPQNQKIVVLIKKKNYLWQDKNSLPMLGYVDPSSLKTEYRRPDSVVYVELELLPMVADRLWNAADEAIHRPNTKPGLDMEWVYTSSYKNMQGQGSGSGLWFPREVLFYRHSHHRPEEDAAKDNLKTAS